MSSNEMEERAFKCSIYQKANPSNIIPKDVSLIFVLGNNLTSNAPEEIATGP
jgi:hypothetical protein